MEIPSFLETQIREGKVVLLLGAGASRNAKNSKGQTPPTGPELASMLSDRFLGGEYKNLSLNQVGEYSISERGDGLNDWIYVHRSNVEDRIWKALTVGARVKFRVAFSFRGPSACGLELVAE